MEQAWTLSAEPTLIEGADSTHMSSIRSAGQQETGDKHGNQSVSMVSQSTEGELNSVLSNSQVNSGRMQSINSVNTDKTTALMNTLASFSHMDTLSVPGEESKLLTTQTMNSDHSNSEDAASMNTLVTDDDMMTARSECCMETVPLNMDTLETVPLNMETPETVSLNMETPETVSLNMETPETVSLNIETPETVPLNIESTGAVSSVEETFSGHPQSSRRSGGCSTMTLTNSSSSGSKNRLANSVESGILGEPVCKKARYDSDLVNNLEPVNGKLDSLQESSVTIKPDISVPGKVTVTSDISVPGHITVTMGSQLDEAVQAVSQAVQQIQDKVLGVHLVSSAGQCQHEETSQQGKSQAESDPVPAGEGQSPSDPKPADENQSHLTEIQAGITEYLGQVEGFTAIIKQRYSDFIVNEINMQGEVVYLTSLEVPQLSHSQQSNSSSKHITETILDVIGAEDMCKLNALLTSANKKDIVSIVAPSDKDSRSKIHLAIKNHFQDFETKTAEVDKQKVIQVMFKSGKSREAKQREWPESMREYKYVKCVLYKENKDTMDSIGLIARNLKVKENLFQYAGNKDKRAKTSQEITVNGVLPQKLVFLNKVLRNMALGNFQFVKEPLKLGQLSGNQFTIVLRNVLGSTEVVDAALTSLKTVGFINYFGMQRFGTTSVPTHSVGCALLHGGWQTALDLILRPRSDCGPKDVFQKVWNETKDPGATLKVTPAFCGLERNILRALKDGLKPFNALEKIPRNTRLLYVHSYQAFVWNHMVSKRLKVFGLRPLVGDLVLPDSVGSATPILVTEDNIHQFTLHHIVLPLPGYDILYPQNEVRQWYQDMLAGDGLDINNMRRPQKDYSLPGAYRHMTVCPTHVSWSHHRYDDYTNSLTLSDLDKIKGDKLSLTQDQGKLKAVVLKMRLPTSCYATMALREVLHADTSAAHQTSLNIT